MEKRDSGGSSRRSCAPLRTPGQRNTNKSAMAAGMVVGLSTAVHALAPPPFGRRCEQKTTAPQIHVAAPETRKKKMRYPAELVLHIPRCAAVPQCTVVLHNPLLTATNSAPYTSNISQGEIPGLFVDIVPVVSPFFKATSLKNTVIDRRPRWRDGILQNERLLRTRPSHYHIFACLDHTQTQREPKVTTVCLRSF